MPSAAVTEALDWLAQARTLAATLLPGYQAALATAKGGGDASAIADARIDLGLMEGARTTIDVATTKAGRLT